MINKQKITPFLWFNGQAEQAARFYASVFKNSKVVDANAMSATFELEGLTFIALNGGPHYKFNPAVSFFISCENQDEVDYYWDKLTAGGKPGRCGWLEDQFGVSWQVVPTTLGSLLCDTDRTKADRALQAMLKMGKLDISALKAAHAG